MMEFFTPKLKLLFLVICSLVCVVIVWFFTGHKVDFDLPWEGKGKIELSNSIPGSSFSFGNYSELLRISAGYGVFRPNGVQISATSGRSGFPMTAQKIRISLVPFEMDDPNHRIIGLSGNDTGAVKVTGDSINHVLDIAIWMDAPSLGAQVTQWQINRYIIFGLLYSVSFRSGRAVPDMFTRASNMVGGMDAVHMAPFTIFKKE